MSVVFIDSDILLDVILIRPSHYFSSVQILALTEKEGYFCCTSVHTLLNIHYVTKRHLGIADADKAVKLLFNKLNIIEENYKTIEQAISSKFKDFEDAVQYYAAISAKADVIITRNIKDYKEAVIPVLTAEQFLRTL